MRRFDTDIKLNVTSRTQMKHTGYGICYQFSKFRRKDGFAGVILKSSFFRDCFRGVCFFNFQLFSVNPFSAWDDSRRIHMTLQQSEMFYSYCD